MPKTPVIIVLFAAFLFGAATPTSKVLMVDIPPFQLAGLLYIDDALGVIPHALLTSSIISCNKLRLMKSVDFSRISLSFLTVS